MELIFFVSCLAIYTFTGFSIKLIDQVNDENFEINNKMKIFILILSPILAGVFMGIDIYVASIGLTLLLGLFIANKINVKDFRIYAILVLASMLIVSIFNYFYIFLNIFSIIITLIFLLIGVVLDEILNNYLDSKSIQHPVFKHLTSIRPILKIIVFILPIFNLFTYYHAVIVLFFDFAYDSTKYLTEKQMNRMSQIE